MRKIIACLAVVALTLPLPSCNHAREQGAEFFVFGTLVEVVVRDADQRSATAAFAELQQRFQEMHRDWHAWEPGMLGDINEAFASGRKIAVPADIRALIELSQEIEASSHGRFNAAAGALIGLWGFHTSTFPVTTPVPRKEELDQLLAAAPSASDIIFEGNLVYSNNPVVQLDFGGIAKGFAADIALEILSKHGIEKALVNAGGDLMASGSTSAQPWTVGIRRPGGGIVGGIEVIGTEAVFTSGIDQRFLQQGDTRYPHILDPRTGQPVKGLASVTVISERGSYADAAATTLMVGGKESWQELVKVLDLKAVLLIDEDGQLLMTPEMKNRLIVDQ